MPCACMQFCAAMTAALNESTASFCMCCWHTASYYPQWAALSAPACPSHVRSCTDSRKQFSAFLKRKASARTAALHGARDVSAGRVFCVQHSVTLTSCQPCASSSTIAFGLSWFFIYCIRKKVNEVPVQGDLLGAARRACRGAAARRRRGVPPRHRPSRHLCRHRGQRRWVRCSSRLSNNQCMLLVCAKRVCARARCGIHWSTSSSARAWLPAAAWTAASRAHASQRAPSWLHI